MSEQGKTSIFFRGSANPTNLGDWLIIKTLLECLTAFGTVVCYDAKLLDYGIEGLEYVDHPEFHSRLYHSAKHCQGSAEDQVFLVLNPGHHFSTVASEEVYSGRQSEHQWLQVCKNEAIRIVRFGVSIGPFVEKERPIEKRLGKLFDFYSARESWSLEYVQGLGISNARRFCDLAFLARIPDVKTLGECRDRILLSFRECIMGSEIPERYDFDNLIRIIGLAYQALQGVAERDFYLGYQTTADAEFSARLGHTLIENSMDLKMMYGEMDWQRAEETYSRTDIVLSNRLHVLLIGMLLGGVPIAVIDAERHTKISALFADLGLSHLILHVNNRSEESIREQVVDIHANREGIRQQLKAVIAKERQVGWTQLSTVFQNKALTYRPSS